jgi:hypothetical protein
MFDDDQVTQSPELRELRDSLNGIAMPARPPLAAIAIRGRAHRRNRYSGVAGLFVTGAAAGAVLTVALAGGGTTHDTVVNPLPRLDGTSQTIRTGSYTLISDTSGNVKLTINPRKLFHPAALQSDLARFGIPAKVTNGRICTSDPEPAGLHSVVTLGIGRRQTVTFDPAAIPAGTELGFSRFRLKEGVQMVSMVLIDTDHFTCTATAPTDEPNDNTPRLAYLAIPAGPARSHG